MQVSDHGALELVSALIYAMQVPSLAVNDIAAGAQCSAQRLNEEVAALCAACEAAGQPPREMAYHLIQAARVWLCALPPVVTLPASLTVSERVKALAL